MDTSSWKSFRFFLSCSIPALVSVAWACTATGGLDRYTLGLDPALACNDPKALKRVLDIDLMQVAQAGNVLAVGGVLPLRPEQNQYRFLRPQPIRGLRLTGLANRIGDGDSLAIAFDEPLAFLRPFYERAGWRFQCQRLPEGERCLAQREIVLADGSRQAARVEIMQPVEATAAMRSYIVCAMPGLSALH